MHPIFLTTQRNNLIITEEENLETLFVIMWIYIYKH